MLSVWVILSFISIPAGALPPEGPIGMLDGMVFVGHVGPKGEGANGEDEVVFEKGRFLSTGCSKYGFERAPYSATRNGSRIEFEAVTRSPKHGEIHWRGFVMGKKLTATYVWTKERWYWLDAHEENWFRGELKRE